MKPSGFMNIHPYALALASCFLVSCAQVSKVKVVDAYDKLPVASASVIAVRGDFSTPPVLTDSKGEVVQPTLPNGAEELVIRKPGYNTTRIQLTH